MSSRTSQVQAVSDVAATPQHVQKGTDTRCTSSRISELVWRPAHQWCVRAVVPEGGCRPQLSIFNGHELRPEGQLSVTKCRRCARRSLNYYNARVSWLKGKHFLWREAPLKLITVYEQGGRLYHQPFNTSKVLSSVSFAGVGFVLVFLKSAAWTAFTWHFFIGTVYHVSGSICSLIRSSHRQLIGPQRSIE